MKKIKEKVKRINSLIRKERIAYLNTDLGSYKVNSVESNCWIYVEGRSFMGTENDLDKILKQLEDKEK